MPNWTTQLEVTVKGKPIALIESFTPHFSTPYTVYHTLSGDNQGYIRQPFTFKFDMTVVATDSAVADLTEMALNGTHFDVAIAEKKGTDWSFKSIKYSDCVIIGASPSALTTTTAPTVTFNCAALSMNIEKGS